MKTLKIISRKKAHDMLMDSLFKLPKTLTESKWCNGKYKNSGIGKEIKVTDDIQAVYTKRGSDKHGAYYKIWCLK